MVTRVPKGYQNQTMGRSFSETVLLILIHWSTKLPKWFPKVPACAQSGPNGSNNKENQSNNVPPNVKKWKHVINDGTISQVVPIGAFGPSLLYISWPLGQLNVLPSDNQRRGRGWKLALQLVGEHHFSICFDCFLKRTCWGLGCHCWAFRCPCWTTLKTFFVHVASD